MHGDVLLLIAVLVLGVAAFAFGLVYMIFTAVVWIARNLFRLLTFPLRMLGMRRFTDRVRRTCPRRQCRAVEQRGQARYCGRCGMPLRMYE